MSDNPNLKYELMLAMSGIKPETVLYLLECFGSAEEVFKASPEQLITAQLSEKIIAKLSNIKSAPVVIDKELEFINKYSIRALPINDRFNKNGYPDKLSECVDAPSVLYVKGDIEFNNPEYKWISIVGTRRTTAHGVASCERVVAMIAEKYPDTVIVSGLAYGIDSVAHRAAIKNGLKTVAVVAHGLDIIYPSDHRNLAKDIIASGGAVITDYPSETLIMKYNFLQRNRIVAGLSDATIVIESPEKGGSLITAEMADGYNRTVFACPGRIMDKSFAGNNRLIKRSTAILLSEIEDIEYQLGWKSSKEVRKFNLSLNDDEQLIYNCFETASEISDEELMELTRLNPGRFYAMITNMEMNGVIKSVAGKMYIRTDK